MKINNLKSATLLTFLMAASTSAHAAPIPTVFITEVASWGSSSSYGADWFELTNTGVSSLDITGWMMDDNSAAFGSAVALRGVTSIAAGQSAIFLEGNATGTTDATIDANFKTVWFGTNPTSLVIGNYGGSGVGLSTAGDAVNIYNSTGTLMANVSFGAATTSFSFDNAAGLTGAISLLSAVGTNGAFTSSNGIEVGSPGTVSSVPVPAAVWMFGTGLLGLIRSARKRTKA